MNFNTPGIAGNLRISSFSNAYGVYVFSVLACSRLWGGRGSRRAVLPASGVRATAMIPRANNHCKEMERRISLLKSSWLLMFWSMGPAAFAGETSPEARTSKRFGTECREFNVDGRYAFVLLPTSPADDGTKPWLWYAPTFEGGHPEPSLGWLFTRLLQNGFAIAGIDVGESYGSPQGRKSYTMLYEHLRQRHGLAAQASLLPQSRGGLMLYNWAAENPEKVKCIGGIYTVCDLESYPGLARACGAYGLTESQLRQQLADHNPVQRLAPLARTRIPILHVHGDADVGVPLEPNSAELVKRYRELAGPAELIVVRGKGHEVIPEFFENQRLIDFFLNGGDHASP